MKLYGWYADPQKSRERPVGIYCIDIDINEVELITNNGEYRLRHYYEYGIWYKTFTQAKQECVLLWKERMESANKAIACLMKQRKSEVM